MCKGRLRRPVHMLSDMNAQFSGTLQAAFSTIEAGRTVHNRSDEDR